jgi:hypothetical protein
MLPRISAGREARIPVGKTLASRQSLWHKAPLFTGRAFRSLVLLP